MSAVRLDSGMTYFTTIGEDCLEEMNDNVIIADAFLGRGAVDFAEVPSASLNVAVSAFGYRNAAGARASYAGTASFAVDDDATSYLWLTDGGTLTKGAAWPTGTDVVRLASVVAAGGVVTSVVDAREAFASFGGGGGSYLPLGGGTLTGNLAFADAVNVVVNTTTGTKIGTSASQKLGFWDATPVVQPASADQAALTDSTGGDTSDAILADPGIISDLIDSSGGTGGAGISAITLSSALTGGAGGSADGAIQSISGTYTQAEVANNFDELMARANELRSAVVVIRDGLATLAAAVNALAATEAATNDNVAKVAELVNALRAAMVASGLAKGSA